MHLVHGGQNGTQPSIVSGGWTHTARPRGAVAGQAPTVVPAPTDLDTWRSAEPPDTQGPWPAALLRAPSRHVHRPEAGSGCRAGEGEGRWNVLELEEAVAQHRERADRHQTVYSKTVNSALCDFPLRERFAQRFGESRSVSLAAARPRPAPPAGSRGPRPWCLSSPLTLSGPGPPGRPLGAQCGQRGPFPPGLRVRRPISGQGERHASVAAHGL